MKNGLKYVFCAVISAIVICSSAFVPFEIVFYNLAGKCEGLYALISVHLLAQIVAIVVCLVNYGELVLWGRSIEAKRKEHEVFMAAKDLEIADKRRDHKLKTETLFSAVIEKDKNHLGG